jgi:hypothetical protein
MTESPEPQLCTFEYAIVRIVPRVERQEFMNVGVVLSSATRHFLQARIELDEARVHAFAPQLDIDALREHLESIPRICAGGAAGGPIGQLPQRARFHWLVAPRSTIVQCSPVHLGRCHSPEALLEHLLNTMVRPPAGTE